MPKASKDLTLTIDQTNTIEQLAIPSDPELYKRAINEGRDQLVQQRSKAAAAKQLQQEQSITSFRTRVEMLS